MSDIFDFSATTQARTYVAKKSAPEQLANSKFFWNLFNGGSDKSKAGAAGTALAKAALNLIPIPYAGAILTKVFEYITNTTRKNALKDNLTIAKIDNNLTAEAKYLTKLINLDDVGKNLQKSILALKLEKQQSVVMKAKTILSCDDYYNLAIQLAQAERRLNLLEIDGENLIYLGGLISDYARENNPYINKKLLTLNKDILDYAKGEFAKKDNYDYIKQHDNCELWCCARKDNSSQSKISQAFKYSERLSDLITSQNKVVI